MPNQPPSTDYLPYLFLAVMIIAGGIVAFVADGLGRKIGKKRLSFFGLRPRYTATLITVGAGILIPIITILAIYGLSSDVREWIQEGRGAQRRAIQAQARADEWEKEADSLEVKYQELQGTNKKLTHEQQKLTSEQAKLTRQVEENKAAVAAAEQKREAAQQKVQVTERKLATAESKMVETDKAIVAKTEEIKEKQAEVQKTLKEVALVRQNLKSTSNQNNDLSKQNLSLERRQMQLEGELKNSEKELANLQQQRRVYEAEIESYKQSVESYKFSITQYSNQINDLTEKVEQLSSFLKSSFVASRTKPMIFEVGEELARIQLPPSLTPSSARTAFFDLLQRARTSALANKAINSPVTPPAGLIPREFNQRVIGIQEQEEAIIRGIVAQRTELVFIARSMVNSFEGEHVGLEFVAYRNKLVYHEGKLITEKRLDGRKSDADVLSQIQDFIGTNVRNQALKDGIIPKSGSKGLLGRTVSEEELFELIREIRSNNQLVRLQALAKQDTNAGDQLELLFRVRL